MEVNKSFNIFCSEEVDLIPYEEKIPLVESVLVTYRCLSQISGLFDGSRLQSLVVSPESSVFGGCR